MWSNIGFLKFRPCCEGFLHLGFLHLGTFTKERLSSEKLMKRTLLLFTVCAILATGCASISGTPVTVTPVATAPSVGKETSDLAEFAAFVLKYNKTYANADERGRRFAYFLLSRQRAVDMNARHNSNAFGVTPFSDLSHAEFTNRYLTYTPHTPITEDLVTLRSKEWAAADTAAVTTLPAAWDWRDQHVITNVNNQGQCGACWAFSAVETIESAFLLANPAYRPLIISQQWGLSVQEMVDCTNDIVVGGCNGGWADLAYEFVKSNGITDNSQYSWHSGDDGQPGACAAILYNKTTFVSNFTYATPPCLLDCNKQNMHALQTAVALNAPVSICLDADSFDSYTQGILPASSCQSAFSNMNHCIQLVGYNTTAADPSQHYWIARKLGHAVGT